MDFQAIRKEYENRGIDESDMTPNPFEVFKQWFELAVEKCPGRWIEPNVMALATSDGKGRVTNRYVLMKQVDGQAISFFTNYESAKGVQIEANSRVAVAFHWPYLGRQVRIEGTVEKTSRDVSQAYFHSRPRGSQLGAAVSRQSSHVASHKELEHARDALSAEYEGKEIPVPDSWGGYLLRPDYFEFWQGRLDRLHDRIEYVLKQDAWEQGRLSP